MYLHWVSLACFFSHCYTCIKTGGESGILSSTILKKTRRPARIWRIFCWIHIPAWIYRSCIVIHKKLVLDGSLHYVQCVPYAEILQIFLLFSMIWNCRIQSPACPNNEMNGHAVLLFDSDINWQSLKCLYWYGYHDSFMLILHMK